MNQIFLTLHLSLQLFRNIQITLQAPAGLPREDSSLVTANQLLMTNVTEYMYQVVYQLRDLKIFTCYGQANYFYGKNDSCSSSSQQFFGNLKSKRILEARLKMKKNLKKKI